MPIEFDGLEEVLKGLDEIADEETIKIALGKAALIVEDAAKAKAKKGRTGDLAKFIESKVDGLEAIVFSPLKYAPYVEYGTGLFAKESGHDGRTWDLPWRYEADDGKWYSTYGQHPQPFMKPALDENRDLIIQTLREGITK